METQKNLIELPVQFKLTEDMVETLAKFWKDFAHDGVVTLERTHLGIWMLGPRGGRAFLGQADLPEQAGSKASVVGVQ